MNSEITLALGYAGFLFIAAGALCAIARRAERAGTWPQSGAAQLERAIALVLLVVAAILCIAALLRHSQLWELGVLSAALSLSVWAAWRVVRALQTRARAAL
jgi:hypothetical protein